MSSVIDSTDVCNVSLDTDQYSYKELRGAATHLALDQIRAFLFESLDGFKMLHLSIPVLDEGLLKLFLLLSQLFTFRLVFGQFVSLSPRLITE